MGTPCRLFSCTKMANIIRFIEVFSWKGPRFVAGPRGSGAGVRGSDLSALIGIPVLEAGQREIVAQAGDGFGAGISPACGETSGGAPCLGAVESDSVQTLLDGFLLCEPCRGRS